MKLRSLSISLSLLLFVLIIGSRAGSAQEVQPLEPEWLMQMYEEGWRKVQEGVLQRDVGGGGFETFGYGAEGLQWLVQSHEQQLIRLEGEYDVTPSNDLADLIHKLRNHVDRLQGDLGSTPSAESFDGNTTDACSFSYDATASAGSQQSPQGVTAAASAFWESNCGIEGTTFATAYAHAIDGTLETTVTRNDPQAGVSIQSNAIASANGATDCYSWAQAEVRVPAMNIFYQTPLKENYDCRTVLVVSIAGPATITTDYYTSKCADVTWTASVAGGSPPYSYDWYIGTDPAVQGTGSTFTKNYCRTNEVVTVKVVVRDSDGQSDDATFTTSINHIDALVASATGPATVTTDYYSSTCANVTWTAGATGGHPGYTYSWYIGTGTTVQGTGSTFTKNYCSTNQSVTVKVVARDSDGHTDDATFTTSLSHRGAIVPKITATTANSASCVDVTWTASATSSGHTGFTYKWYIGTTLQGSAATLTKRYCTSQTVTMKVVARANDAHEDSTTHTMTVNPIPPLSASIDGPDTGFAGGGNCASLTWTATASGGTPGYTYAWYMNNGTTVLSTTRTLTRTVCTAQTINVKVNVRDSAAKSVDAVFTTTVESSCFAQCP